MAAKDEVAAHRGVLMSLFNKPKTDYVRTAHRVQHTSTGSDMSEQSYSYTSHFLMAQAQQNYYY